VVSRGPCSCCLSHKVTARTADRPYSGLLISDNVAIQKYQLFPRGGNRGSSSILEPSYSSLSVVFFMREPNTDRPYLLRKYLAGENAVKKNNANRSRPHRNPIKSACPPAMRLQQTTRQIIDFNLSNERKRYVAYFTTTSIASSRLASIVRHQAQSTAAVSAQASPSSSLP